MEIIYDPKENDKNKRNIINLKVVLLGEASMGKTTFVSRISSNNYLKFLKEKEGIQPTPGGNYKNIIIKFKDRAFNLDLWEAAGNRRFCSLIKIFCKNANTILIFYDPFDKSSFKRVDEILFQIKNDGITNAILVLISNKYDKNMENINNEDIVSDEEALEYADKQKLFFIHLSNFVKYETGINQILELILNEYLKREKNL